MRDWVEMLQSEQLIGSQQLDTEGSGCQKVLVNQADLDQLGQENRIGQDRKARD